MRGWPWLDVALVVALIIVAAIAVTLCGIIFFTLVIQWLWGIATLGGTVTP